MNERFGRRYDDEERRFGESAPREYEGRTYRGGEGYYGGYGEGTRRTYEGRGRSADERGFLDRAGDEVRSWFGDEEAERRRREDEREARRRGWLPGRSSEGRDRERWGDDRRWGRGSSDYVDEREWARQWGYVDEPYERGGMLGHRSREGYGGGWFPREDPSMSRGPYAGRGPRGYQRSAERIREDVCDRLCEHGAIDASDIEIQVVGAEVTLIGFVPTRSQKRLAEDVADSVSGVNEVHNQLRVSHEASGMPYGQPGATGSTGATGATGATGSQPGGSQTGPTDWRNRAA